MESRRHFLAFSGWVVPVLQNFLVANVISRDWLSLNVLAI
jgi:hypothetical protein